MVKKKTKFNAIAVILGGVLLFAINLAFSPLAEPIGLVKSEPISKFLNGTLPSVTPGSTDPNAAAYSIVPAYTNLFFDQPLVIELHPNDNYLFVASKEGLVEYFEDSPTVASKDILIDLREQVAGDIGDGGFLGLTFHPEFGNPLSPNRNYFYTVYCAKGIDGAYGPTAGQPEGFTCEDNAHFYGAYFVLSRHEVEEGTLNAKPDSEEYLFKIRMYNSTHRGGGLTFGNDGMLYLTIGEQARYETAQNIYSNFEGGVIRIDVDKDPVNSHPPIRKMGVDVGEVDEITGNGYYIPNDNPWQDQTGSVFEEFFTLGHRAPHRLTLDKTTGRIWSGEIGAATHEEINIIEGGKNYGWPVYEGNYLRPNGGCGVTEITRGDYQAPAVDFTRDEANAIIGGYVYRGSEMNGLQGKYICGDYIKNKIFAITEENDGSFSKEQIAYFNSGSLITWGQNKSRELLLGRLGSNVNLEILVGSANNQPAPALLSDLDAFSDLENLTPAPGVIPYDMTQPFWSDNAEKYRWLAVPNNEDGNGMHDKVDEKIVFSENGNWQFPVGSVMIKHFELGGKRLETRLEVLGEDGVYYYLSYKWNEAQTDAVLLETSEKEVITVNGESHVWYYPSRSDCLQCHSVNVGSVLGLKTRYQNSNITYPTTGVTANQLETYNHLGLFDKTLSSSDITDYLTLDAIDDSEASVEDKARSYLDINCSYCHQPATGNRAVFDARFSTPLEFQNLVEGSLMAESFGATGVIIPGSIAESNLYHRVSSVGATAMPPLAKNKVDEKGVALLNEFISNLTVPEEKVALITRNNAVKNSGYASYSLTEAQRNKHGFVWNADRLDFSKDLTVAYDAYFGSNDEGGEGMSLIFQQNGQGVANINALADAVGFLFDTSHEKNDMVSMYSNGDFSNVVESERCVTAQCDNVESGKTYNILCSWNATTKTMQLFVDGVLRITHENDMVANYFANDPLVYVGVYGYTSSFNVNNQGISYFNVLDTTCEDGNGDGVADCTDADSALLDISFVNPAKNTFIQGERIVVEVVEAQNQDIDVALAVNGYELRTDGVAPHIWSGGVDYLQNLPAGTYTFVATATLDSDTSVTASASYTFTITALPDVEIAFTQPLKSKFDLGETVTVEIVETQNQDINVDLALNGVALRSDNVAPYFWGGGVAGLKNLAPGQYTLEATAYLDGSKKVAATASFTFVVGFDIAFAKPFKTTYAQGETLTVEVIEASDMAIDVDLTLNGLALRNDVNPPYIWGGGVSGLQNLPIGQHTLMASATLDDNKNITATTSFTFDIIASDGLSFPDPTKVYFIDNLYFNTRLASDGESESPYLTTTDTNTADTRWQFVPVGDYWHIQRAAGGTTPRLRTDNTLYADMQSTASAGRYTQFQLNPSSSVVDNYYLDLPLIESWSGNSRLQVTGSSLTSGLVRMVGNTSMDKGISFRITEANGVALKASVTNLLVNPNSDMEDFTIYPMPVKEVLYITNISKFASIRIYDVKGQLVKEKKASQTVVTEINVSTLPQGTYFVALQEGEAITTKQIIKQ